VDPLLVDEPVADEVDLELSFVCTLRCFIPAAEGCCSVPVVDVLGELDELDEGEELDEEEASAAFTRARSFSASGVLKSEMDLVQNLCAAERLPALRCFWAIPKQRRASSLLLSMVTV
jgi:hypothetical protein